MDGGLFINKNGNADSLQMSILEDDSLYLNPKAINLHVSMPCPLKVPFKNMFAPFVEEYNNKHKDLPMHCPDITDCGSADIGTMLETAKSEDDLPDIIITTNYSILFSDKFYNRFLKTGVYKGLIKDSYQKKLPESITNDLLKSNLGLLCFSSWSFVQDLTVEGMPQDIDSWKYILSPEAEGKLTVHGHLDKASFGIVYFLKKNFGDEAVAQFANNIADIKHFSQVIKRMGSGNLNKTALSLLPDVAVSKIPSNKKVKILNLKEGKVANPMVLIVKVSKEEKVKEIIDKFWSPEFTAMLHNGGCIMPDELKDDVNYFVPDFPYIAEDFENLEKTLNDEYMDHLQIDKIKEKETLGGVCGVH